MMPEMSRRGFVAGLAAAPLAGSICSPGFRPKAGVQAILAELAAPLRHLQQLATEAAWSLVRQGLHNEMAESVAWRLMQYGGGLSKIELPAQNDDLAEDI